MKMNKELEALGKNIRYKKEYVGNDTYRLYIKKNEIELLENYLIELEQIKNANPSEALEILEDLRKQVSFANSDGCIFDDIYDDIIKDIELIKQALINFDLTKDFLKDLSKLINETNLNKIMKKLQEQENENAEYKKIAKEIVEFAKEGITLGIVRKIKQERDNYKRVLEIIKEKGVDVGYLKTCETLEEYNSNCWNDEEDFNKKLNQEEFDLLKRYFK